MSEPRRIFVGYDRRESVAYHTFCQSVLETASEPVSFTPLVDTALSGVFRRTGEQDGSNAFTYSRFLVPYLCGYKGWALFVDGDMVCASDIIELFNRADEDKAVMVVKHDYATKFPVKYLGAKNADYPRKNWSSVMLFNCGHPANETLTPSMVATLAGKYLHRLWWLDDNEIGTLPSTWNWLVSEYPPKYDAKLYHYTIGTPCFDEYRECDHAELWHLARKRMTHADQR